MEKIYHVSGKHWSSISIDFLPCSLLAKQKMIFFPPSMFIIVISKQCIDFNEVSSISVWKIIKHPFPLSSFLLEPIPAHIPQVRQTPPTAPDITSLKSNKLLFTRSWLWKVHVIHFGTMTFVGLLGKVFLALLTQLWKVILIFFYFSTYNPLSKDNLLYFYQFSIPAVRNYYKFSGLKQPKITTLLFCRLEVMSAGLHFFLEALGENLFAYLY